MQFPLHLWLPRAVAWIGVVIVGVLSAVWFVAPLEEKLGTIGGIWAICRVIQFLLMTKGAQSVLIWLGGQDFRVIRPEAPDHPK